MNSDQGFERIGKGQSVHDSIFIFALKLLNKRERQMSSDESFVPVRNDYMHSTPSASALAVKNSDRLWTIASNGAARARCLPHSELLKIVKDTHMKRDYH
jgi:hypothetical protein